MKLIGTLKLCVVAFAAATLALPAQARTEIQWWHSMTGSLNDWVNDLAKNFNASQTEYEVIPTYKGSYGDSMNATIAAFRAHKAPDIVQIYEVGTATMMAAKGAIKPVEDVMRLGGQKFDRNAYIPAVAGYYSTSDGKMLSFPFNSSTVVFYYNKDAFKAAGLDPNKPPITWPEVFADAAKLKAAGNKCPLTTSWMSWTQLENFSTWHDVPFASLNNGFGGPAARLEFNGPLQVRHFDDLARLSKEGEFVYRGRGSAADASIISGECAMTTASSGLYGALSSQAKFKFGVSTLPYYPDVPHAPQNTIIGGASLWVMNGKSDKVYKGVAAFFHYLSEPQVAAMSHQRTGYLPVTLAAYELTKNSGYYEKHPGSEVAVTQMIRKVTPKTLGIRLGNFNQIRTIINEETEQIWTGKKTAKEALDDAVKRGNEQLVMFQKSIGQ